MQVVRGPVDLPLVRPVRRVRRVLPARVHPQPAHRVAWVLLTALTSSRP